MFGVGAWVRLDGADRAAKARGGGHAEGRLGRRDLMVPRAPARRFPKPGHSRSPAPVGGGAARHLEVGAVAVPPRQEGQLIELRQLKPGGALPTQQGAAPAVVHLDEQQAEAALLAALLKEAIQPHVGPRAVDIDLEEIDGPAAQQPPPHGVRPHAGHHERQPLRPLETEVSVGVRGRRQWQHGVRGGVLALVGRAERRHALPRDATVVVGGDGVDLFPVGAPRVGAAGNGHPSKVVDVDKRVVMIAHCQSQRAPLNPVHRAVGLHTVEASLQVKRVILERVDAKHARA
eukprot:scaffold16485_cov65-Phaeocystis_antarctica.AAC.7